MTIKIETHKTKFNKIKGKKYHVWLKKQHLLKLEKKLILSKNQVKIKRYFI